MSLRWTPLRHKILSEVEAGRYSVYVGFLWNLRHEDGQWVRSDVCRTLRTSGFVGPEHLAVGREQRARLTDAGRAALAAWTAQHGKPT